MDPLPPPRVPGEAPAEPADLLLVVGAAVVREGRCLVTQRSTSMSEPGTWEFPGGKVEEGEDAHTALRRELAEELGLEVEVGLLLGQGHAAAAGRPLRLDVYLVHITGGELRLREHANHRWIGPEQVWELVWAPADVPVLPALEARLREISTGQRRAGREPTPPRRG